jgi:hypothetical protein
MDTQNSIITILVALITAVLGPSAVEWIKIHLTKTKSRDLLGESINVDEKIDKQLEILQKELDCDRICLAQFHNGGHFYPTGQSIRKFSIFYEKLSPNTLSVKETFQNIPVSLFPKTFSLLYRQGEIIIPKCKENTIECGLFQINGKNYKTKSFYILSIKDLDNNFIGSLTISYYTKEHDLTPEEWMLVRQKIGVLGTILTNYLHGKK